MLATNRNTETVQPTQTAINYGYTDTESSHPRSASARIVVPILNEILLPRSVVDVGCGTGTWLQEFLRLGVEDVLGLDGDWIPRELLKIPTHAFKVVDLNKKIEVAKRFDLAMCLEVGEHLPQRVAPVLVDSLISLSSVVCFSASIPGQRGYAHINEQWQDYWIGLFKERNYRAYDLIRPLIWSNPTVAFYYAQNLLVYVSATVCEEFERRTRIRNLTNHTFIPTVVHPVLYALKCDPRYYSLKAIFRVLHIMVWYALQRRLPFLRQRNG